MLQTRLSTLLVLLASAFVATEATPQQAVRQSANTCPVTLPRQAPRVARGMFAADAAHWNGSLFVGGLWRHGTVVFRPGGPGFIFPDGSLGMKFGWFRGPGLRGKLIVHGNRLDASAPPLRADIPRGNGDTGFQPSVLIFPTEGCWKVTGEVGDAHLTFVTLVVRIRGPQ